MNQRGAKLNFGIQVDGEDFAVFVLRVLKPCHFIPPHAP